MGDAWEYVRESTARRGIRNLAQRRIYILPRPLQGSIGNEDGKSHLFRIPFGQDSSLHRRYYMFSSLKQDTYLSLK